MDRVEEEEEDGDEREVTEPHDVAYGQDPVQQEGSGTYLNDVHLSHLVEEVEEDEEAIGEVDSTNPALVAVVQAERQRVHLL